MKKLNFKQLFEKLILTEDDAADELNNLDIGSDELSNVDTTQDNDLDNVDTSTPGTGKQDWCALMKAASDKNWVGGKGTVLMNANKLNGKEIIPGLKIDKVTAFDVFKIFAYHTYNGNAEAAEKMLRVGTQFIADAYDVGTGQGNSDVYNLVGLTDNNPVIKNVKDVLKLGCDLNKNTYGNANAKLGIAAQARFTQKTYPVGSGNIMFCKDLYTKTPDEIWKYLAFQKKAIDGKNKWDGIYQEKDLLKCIFYLGGKVGDAVDDTVEATNLTKLKPIGEVQEDVAKGLGLEVTDVITRPATANDYAPMADSLIKTGVNVKKINDILVTQLSFIPKTSLEDVKTADSLCAKNGRLTADANSSYQIGQVLNNSGIDWRNKKFITELLKVLN